MRKVCKNLIKKVIPQFVVDIYRLHGKIFYYYIRIVRMKMMVEYSILLGTPLHENLGDHLITLAERKFLADLNEGPIIEIPIEAFKLFKRTIASSINSNTKIYIQGGGWMGTTWPQDEFNLQNMIAMFDINPIIVFPQTAFYDCNCSYFSKIVTLGNKVYQKKNVLICFREDNSYKQFNQIFPKANILLQPDITLYLKPKIRGKESRVENRSVAVCFRKDRENYKDELKKEIMEYLIKSKISFEIVDTISKNNVKEKNREKVIEKKMEEFGKFDLIITDRLHAMILTYLVGKKCIAIDKKTHKVSSIYNTWMQDCDQIMYADNFDDFVRWMINPKINNKKKTFNFDALKRIVYYGKD